MTRDTPQMKNLNRQPSSPATTLSEKYTVPSRTGAVSRGFTLVELFLVIVVIMILAGIAIPGILAYRRSANEGSAVATLRTIHGAEMTFQATSQEGNFAGSLSTLAEQNLIDSTLGAGLKSGYNFSGGKVDGSPDSIAKLFYSAIPVKSSGMDRTGSRRFGVATDGVIRYSEDNVTSSFDGVEDVSSAAPFSNK